MDKELLKVIAICFCLLLASTAIGYGLAFLNATQEAAAFNRFTTGPKVTVWDAMWLDLRVEAR